MGARDPPVGPGGREPGPDAHDAARNPVGDWAARTRDASDVHHAVAAEAVTSARERGDTLLLPSSAYAECLVPPCRRGPEAVAVVDSFVDALPARVEPASRAIASTVAELRARHGGELRLPDALVVATALVLRADRLITPDAGWPALPVPVEVLAPAE